MLRRTFVSLAAVTAVLAFSIPVRGVSAETVRMAITDLEGLEALQREFGQFKDVLSAKTGLDIEFFAVPNRTAAVEAMRAARVDLVLTGPAEYVIFKARGNAQPIAGFSRPDYFADLVVLADSGITDVRQLDGKRIALGSVGSTSKHLAPMQLLKDHGLEPLQQVKIEHISSYKTAWEALKRGDVTAFGITDDKFMALRGSETELPPGAFRVIARSSDLPNDVLLARPDLDPAVVGKVQAALRDNSDELVAAILVGEDNQKYRGMKFLTDIKDSDYDYVRAMYKTAGYDKFAKFPGD